MEMVAELMAVSVEVVHKYGKDVVPELKDPMPGKFENFPTASITSSQASNVGEQAQTRGQEQSSARTSGNGGSATYNSATALLSEDLDFVRGDMVNHKIPTLKKYFRKHYPWVVRTLDEISAITPYDRSHPETFLPVLRYLIENGKMIEGQIQAVQREMKRQEEEKLLGKGQGQSS